MEFKQKIFLLLSLLLFSRIIFAHGGKEHKSSQEVRLEKVISNSLEIEFSKINKEYKFSVKPIFAKKCLACHAVNNSLPWYYTIPGVKQLMDHDMEEAKKHLDMSKDFPFGGHGDPLEDLDELKETIQKGNMPPIQYKIIHRESSLTFEEIQEVNSWIDRSKELILSRDIKSK